jgi:hypothetical protein
MAVSLEGINLTKQRARAETRKPKIQLLLKTLFSYLAQHKGNPDLQFVAFSGLTSTDVVVADAACKVYAQYMKKPSTSSTAAFVKDLLIFPDGKSMANGYTLISNTTSGGGTGTAAADQCSGFVIIGG